MKRSLLLALLVALVSLGCTGAAHTATPPKDGIPCATAFAAAAATATASPAATGTAGAGSSRATPEAAVCAFHADLAAGNCEAILADFTQPAVDKAVAKAGSKNQLCAGFQTAAKETVSHTTVISVFKKSDNGVTAVVTLSVTDTTNNRVDVSDINLAKDGGVWKVTDFPLV